MSPSPVKGIPANVAIKDGEPVVVIRPLNPKRAIAMSADILDRQRLGRITPWRAAKELDAMLDKGEYRFMGFLRSDSKAIVNTGISDLALEEGDQYISLTQLATFNNLSARGRNN